MKRILDLQKMEVETEGTDQNIVRSCTSCTQDSCNKTSL
jgi:hypothetical protein